ncbi:electron transfer flavoprotein subunit beta/FixA family protein [Demequina sp. NBRC 110055]|uniref:electron transfer flavoprotein subunit beta/FixA family protein n=1 Tax=Demequina sp. NBRC 110055 TaxID=1570344 RepID=UPI000A028E5C|nr:electron transfer flavoprotein subunit beta/FixA family protein [Demequina sp. NBRC 110055]
MKILVLMKVVPDTYVDRTLSLETGLVTRTSEEAVLDEVDERALEVALAYADAHEDTEVVTLAMAPELGQTSLRKALAMGAHHTVQVVDEALVGADLVLTAQVLAAAATHVGFDLILAGDTSTDGGGGAVPAAMSELLRLPCASALSEVTLADDGISGVRASDGAVMKVSAPLPAIASVTEALGAPRMPNFKGILAAKKKEIEVLTLADLGVDADDPDAARTIMLTAAARPPRAPGVKIVDDGTAGEQLAAFLVDNRLA